MIGFLLSYYYVKSIKAARQIVTDLDPRPPMFADCGAYTAHKSGETISVREYGEWALANQDLYDVFASLDVKSDADASYKNLLELESMGVPRLLPVFHGGEETRLLEGYCEQYDYVALGGIAGGSSQASNPEVLGWLDQCFSIAAKHGSSLHGFGMTNWQVMSMFPWRSVDSSSLGSGYRFGQVAVYDPHHRRWLKLKISDRAKWGKIGSIVREYGFSPADFAEPRSTACTQALIRLGTSCIKRAVADLPPSLQFYIVDDLGKQSGLRRIVEFNKANV